MKKQTRAQLILSRRQYQKLMQWKLKFLISQKMNAKWKSNHL
ncbi:putative exonuclease [Escherichia coli 2720900]|nr:putative exonuclease [Escherichia coli 2720900]